MMTGIPWRGGGGVVILLVVSSEGNWDKLLLAGPLGSSTDLTFFFLNDYNKYSVIQLSFKTTEFYHLNSPSGVLKYLLWNKRKCHVFAAIWTVYSVGLC